MWNRLCEWCDTPMGTTTSLVIVVLFTVVMIQMISLVYMTFENEVSHIGTSSHIETDDVM